MNRSDVTFSSGRTDCAAWLYRPDGEGPVPLVVMAHGFSATREQRLDAYAERFCAAGFGALVFDYRYFGASGGLPRQLLDIRSQQDDYRAAVAYARRLDWVDPDRVALFGSSFSGAHVLSVAAGDPLIAAVVSQGLYSDSLASLPWEWRTTSPNAGLTINACFSLTRTAAPTWNASPRMLPKPAHASSLTA